ncbi:Uncharacterised protein [Serratia proteamaculans]|nr:Uncharacterised protein [Serratia proteamaculans]
MMNGCGQEEDAILPDITVKPFTGIRFKAPRPPDHSTFRVTNHQAEVATLVVFNSDILIPAGNRFGLLSGKRSRWQHVRFRHSVYLKSKSP